MPTSVHVAYVLKKATGVYKELSLERTSAFQTLERHGTSRRTTANSIIFRGNNRVQNVALKLLSAASNEHGV